MLIGVAAAAFIVISLAGCTFLYYRETVVLRLGVEREAAVPGAYAAALSGNVPDVWALLREIVEADVGKEGWERYLRRLDDAAVALFVQTGGKAPFQVVLRQMSKVLSSRTLGSGKGECHPFDLAAVFDGTNRECLASTLAYIALGRRSGLRLYPVLTRGHVMVLYDDGVNRLYVDAPRSVFEPSRMKLSLNFFGARTPPEPYIRALSDTELAAVLLANRAILLSDPVEALKNAEAAAVLFPGLPMAWVNIGFLQARAGRMEEAAAAYRRALDIDGGEPFALKGLASISAGEMTVSPGKPESGESLPAVKQ